jgi:type I restriction enzyme S subunit
MSRWPTVELGEVLHTQIDAVESAKLETVNLAGVYGFARGLFKREPISPLDTTYKRFHRLNAGDFVISSPKAWEGAIARIPEEFDGWFLSPVFPTFRANPDRLDTRYLDWYCKREAVWTQLQGKAKGMGARRESVSPAQFLSLNIPIPKIDEQQNIVARLAQLADKDRQVNEHLDAAETDADNLLAVQFREAIKYAPLRKMSEVAPLVRREISIDSEANYTELGVRSFFKGVFIRRTLPGVEYSWQKLYQVELGDLIFSNIMAWEQAIAIAKAEHDKCVGNHRMLTCAANREIAIPEFIWYYFTTPEGFAKIEATSPGTAARNKTLTADALMNIEVPIPSFGVQKGFASLLAKINELKAKHAKIREASQAMIPATLERIFSSEGHQHG